MAKNDPHLLACLKGLDMADEIAGLHEPDDDYDVFWNCKGRSPRKQTRSFQDDESAALRGDLV